MREIRLSSASNGFEFTVPLDEITGVMHDSEGEVMVERKHGIYHPVRESMLEVMRRCVQAADEDAGADDRARRE